MRFKTTGRPLLLINVVYWMVPRTVSCWSLKRRKNVQPCARSQNTLSYFRPSENNLREGRRWKSLLTYTAPGCLIRSRAIVGPRKPPAGGHGEHAGPGPDRGPVPNACAKDTATQSWEQQCLSRLKTSFVRSAFFFFISFDLINYCIK